MKYAIVDIGSNAIKYKIFNGGLELIEYYRHPLRLGRDVFSKGYLEDKTIQDLLNLLLDYKKNFKSKNILSVNYIATSALRDTQNAKEIIELLKQHDIQVKIISGDVEAVLLAEWLRQFKSIDHLYGLGGNLRALMQANEIKGPIKASDFNNYIKNYLSIDDTVLIEKYEIPKDRIDIIPEALNLYSLIIQELNSHVIENTFWSISDGLVRKVLKDQL